MTDRITPPEARGLADLLEDSASRSPEALALIYPERNVTFEELRAEASAFSAALRVAGVQPGDRVAVVSQNSPRFVAIVFGAAATGAILVPVNARYRSEDMARVLSHSRPSIVLAAGPSGEQPDLLDRVFRAFAHLLATEDPWIAAPPKVVDIGRDGDTPTGTTRWLDFLATGEAQPSTPVDWPDGKDVALILYTSGTSAAPKGCVITHHALIANWRTWAQMLDLGADDRVWAPGPYFHISGIGPLIGCVSAGAATISAAHPEGEVVAQAVLEHEAAHLFPGFPALALALLEAPSYDKASFGFVRTLHNVAPPEAQAAIEARLPDGAVVTSNFGMTEGVGAITYTRPWDSLTERLETVGTPLEGYEVRVADAATDESLPADVRGEIQFRSPTSFVRYWDDEEATRSTIIDGGWIKTGDLGMLTAGGHLLYLGRLKDMLKVGGENLSPIEVENVLSRHPAVRNAQVVGRHDQRLGEVPVAFVELRPGLHAQEVELISHVAERLAAFKVPRSVYFVTAWPMNATKIRKDTLREWALHGPPSG